MSKHPYQVVLGRVRAYIKADGQGEGGVYELYRIWAEVASQLERVPPVTVLDGRQLGTQVRRALDAIAAEGTLVKVRRSEYGPDGTRDGRWPRYYTPDAFRCAEEAHARAQEAAAARTRRWGIVHDNLRAGGIHVPVKRGERVALQLEDWERVGAVIRMDAERI